MRSALALVWGCVVALGCACGARGQVFDLETGREPVSLVDGIWRFHPGDDAGWAAAGLDDSGWALVRGDRSWAEQGYRGLSGLAWYRFAVEGVPARGVSLLLPRLMTDYEVFADGRRIGGYGRMPARPGGRGSMQTPPERVYALPDGAAGRRVEIAIRVWHDPLLAPYVGGGISGRFARVGGSELLLDDLGLWQAARSSVEASTYTMSVLYAVVGLMVLGLFFWRPSEREYLWFAVLLLAQCADALLILLTNLHGLAVSTRDWVEGWLFAANLLASLLFFSTVVRTRRTGLWRFAFGAACLLPLVPALYHVGLPVWSSTAAQALLAAPTAIWILTRLVRKSVRGDVNARLLLLPALLSYGMNFVNEISWARLQLLGQKDGFGLGGMAVTRTPFYVPLVELTDLLYVMGLLAFLIRRFALSRAHEERYSTELEAARQVQMLLLPARSPETPGFLVESVYLPAQEVGGDFWQIVPRKDGSLLAVVGDVSGKGLQAAMTVSTIMGALRDECERGPGELLVHLNRVLCGQISGFVTCSAASIGADGAVVLANAGHLAPYSNGKERAVDGGLPLGVLEQAEYGETHFPLRVGETLTFVSDGVVEATDRDGNLFGFERTERLSAQSAERLAGAAQLFGQVDDITVISVRWVGVAVEV